MPRGIPNSTVSLSELAQINDANSRMYIEQLANQEPEKPLTPGTINRTAQYVFRTKPGTVRSQRIRIPGVPANPVGRFIDKPEYRQHLQDRYEKKYSQSDREMHRRIQEKVGGFFIEFTHLPRKQECVFQTDDDEVANFIRNHVRDNGNPYVYESVESMRLRSLYTDKTFPNTPDGQKELYEHDLAYRASNASKE